MDGYEIQDQGDLGELEFVRLAKLAGFDVAKPEPDRVGIDFILTERASPYSQATSYDRRYARRSCYVQVKTIGEERKSAVISLSVAEFLAKEAKPCFIAVVRLRSDRTPLDMHLIHIHGDRLTAVLKRLRLEQHRNNRALHNSNMSFAVRKSEKVDAGVGALHVALSRSWDTTEHSYAISKHEQLMTDGYSTHRYSGTFQVSGGLEELVDQQLGLSPIRPESWKVFEHRFEIALPTNELDEAFAGMSIVTSPTSLASVTLKGRTTTGEDREVSFLANLFLPHPDIPQSHFKLRASSPLLEIYFKQQSWGASLRSDAEAWGTIDRPAALADQLTAFLIAGEGDAAVSVVVPDGRRWSQTGLRTDSGLDLSETRYIEQVLRSVVTLEERCGESFPISLDALHEQHRVIRQFHRMLTAPTVRLTFKSDGLPQSAKTDDAVFCSAVPVGSKWLAFAFSAELGPQHYSAMGRAADTVAADWACNFLTLLTMQPIEKDGFLKFVGIVSEARGCAASVYQDPGTFTTGDLGIEIK